jgi:AcrR family transcriptional regulator
VLLYLVAIVKRYPADTRVTAPADVSGPGKAEGRRARSARETRRRILAAAHELFVRQGYAATTVQQVAEVADVAWQTVYAVFGNKPAILSALFDVTVVGDDEPIPMMERPFVRQIADAADPREKAGIFAAHIRRTSARTAGVVAVLEAASASDPAIGQLWQKLADQRRFGMTQAVANFRAAGVLRDDLTNEEAVAVLWFFTGPWPYRAMVTESGLSDDAFESWMAETLYTQLFASSRPPDVAAGRRRSSHRPRT